MSKRDPPLGSALDPITEFIFPQKQDVKSVAISGEWDNWRISTPMQLDETKPTWVLPLSDIYQTIPHTQVQFKFIVNGDHWEVSPLYPKTEGGRTQNNIAYLRVLPQRGL